MTSRLAFDFFLSEMSVSHMHGGGLTLRRVLGPHLSSISAFFHIAAFGDTRPPGADVCNRSHSIAPRIQRLIGTRASCRIRQSRLHRCFHARRVAKKIDRFFPTAGILRGFICPQSADSLAATRQLGRQRALKYVTWMMDDHQVRFRNGELRYNRDVHRLLEQHLKEAQQVFVISPAMQEHYSRHFGVASTVLFGSAARLVEPMESNRIDGPLRLAYFGTVSEWQLGPLKALAVAAPKANATLDVFSFGSPPATLFGGPVRSHEALPPEDVIKQMRSFDAVILPISFEKSVRHMTDLNIATKMSECIASGVVTIVIGPTNAAMCRFLDGSEAAIIVNSMDETAICAALNKLHDPGFRRTLLGRARDLAQNELSTEVMRSRYTSAVESLTQSK